MPSFAVSPRTEARRRRTGEGQGWQGAGFHLVLDLLVIFNQTNLAAVAIRLMRCGPSGTPPASRAKAASPLPSNETAGRFLVPLQLLEGNRHCAEHAALKPWTDPLHRICGASRGSLQPREGASWAGSKRQRRHRPSWCELLRGLRSQVLPPVPPIHSALGDDAIGEGFLNQYIEYIASIDSAQ